MTDLLLEIYLVLHIPSSIGWIEDLLCKFLLQLFSQVLLMSRYLRVRDEILLEGHLDALLRQRRLTVVQLHRLRRMLAILRFYEERHAIYLVLHGLRLAANVHEHVAGLDLDLILFTSDLCNDLAQLAHRQ